MSDTSELVGREIVVRDRGFLYANWVVEKPFKKPRNIAEHKVEDYCQQLITSGYRLKLAFLDVFVFVLPEKK